MTRGRRRGPPDDAAALAVLVGTQIPDLVDKPLAWWLGVLPAGRSLAHSLLVALPVALLAVLVAQRRGRTGVGIAFAVGYLLHLPGDVVYPVLLGGEAELGFLLYPLVPAESYAGPGMVARVGELFGDFWAFLATPLGRRYLFAEVAMLVASFVLWVGDGWPGPGLFWRRFRRTLSG